MDAAFSTGKSPIFAIIFLENTRDSPEVLPVLVLNLGGVSAPQCCTGNSYGSEDAAFLFTVGSFLLTVELLYLQLRLLAFLLTTRAFVLRARAGKGKKNK